MTDALKPTLSRRRVLQAAAAGVVGLDPALRAAVWAQGSDKPEKEEVKIGFIPLTDCASVVMASVLGFDKKYGVKIVPTKEASWAGVRDKLVNGELDLRACAVRPGLRRAPGHRRAEEGHGRAHDPQQQRPGDHALEGARRQGRGRRRRRWPR